ncbi:LysR family transcriptional regulator [Gottfriedia acidiceleris]|uniref:LysR family transcriptional regulator n=1 Tax=Gottfriedia acidiceleris TaxID=371036 RepID=UPI000B42E73B|nr:LysR family transcriptional regulator [Gottfriedia acidiceleris]
MYIEKLNYLVEVVKEKSITKAAKNLHISTSVISQTITQLEKEWGIKLFKRHKTGTILTEEGKEVFIKASEIVVKYKELKTIVSDRTSKLNAKLYISCVPSISYLIFDKLLSFKKKFPNISINIHENNPDDVLVDIKSGKYDIGFLTISDEKLKNEQDLVYEKLYDGSLCVLVSQDSPLANYSVLTPELLKNENFILYESDHIKTPFDLFFKHANVSFLSKNIDIISRTVKEGLAITLSSDLAKYSPFVLKGDIIAIPLKIEKYYPNPFWYIYSRNTPYSITSEKFLRHLQEEF